MNTHFAGMRNVSGFLLVTALVFCLTVGISSIALAQGRVAPVPAPPQAAAPQAVPQPMPEAAPPAQQATQPAPQAPAPQEPVAQTQAPQPAPQAQSAQAPPVQASTEPGVPLISEGLTMPTPPAATAEVAGITCPPEYVPLVQKTTLALMTENFTFYPVKALDPFVPFISPETTTAQVRVPGEGEEEPRESERPLTPLQKMTVVEIERGLRAITWGELGRKAVIEDSTGKGYIVAVGTPAGERNGVITQIFNDRVVIQQEVWDRQARKRFPQDFTIKLSKKTTGK